MLHENYDIVVDARHYRVEKILKILGVPNIRISQMTPEEHNAIDDALADMDTATLVIEMDKAGFKMKDEPIPTKNRGLGELLEYRDKKKNTAVSKEELIANGVVELNEMIAETYGFPNEHSFNNAVQHWTAPTSFDLSNNDKPQTAVDILEERNKKKLRLRVLLAELLVLTQTEIIGDPATIDNIRTQHDARNAMIEKMAEFNKAAEAAEHFGQSIFPIGGI